MRLDLMTHSTRRHAASAVILACLLGACVSGPGEGRGNYFPSEAEGPFISIANGIRPNIALAGMLQRDTYDKTNHERLFQMKATELEALLKSMSAGLLLNPALQVATLPIPPVEFACPAPRSVPRDAATASCIFPTRFETSPSIDQLRSSGFTHIALLLGEVSKDNLGSDVTWGIVGPTPAFTTETKITYKFRVTARVYDLVTGDVVTEASAVNFASGSHGVMVVWFPYYIAPDEQQYLNSMGRAIGEEVSRRFRFADATGPPVR
jgi:hypothetical protein